MPAALTAAHVARAATGWSPTGTARAPLDLPGGFDGSPGVWQAAAVMPTAATDDHRRRARSEPACPYSTTTSRRSWSPPTQIAAQDRRAGRGDRRRLRRPRAAAGRRAQGRGHGHGRPRPRADPARRRWSSWRSARTARPPRRPGVVRILKDLDRDIAGRDVLVVEDIIDSGLTLSLAAAQPAQPRTRRRSRSWRCCASPRRSRSTSPVQVRRLRHPERVRRRLRPGLRRALPRPAVRRPAAARRSTAERSPVTGRASERAGQRRGTAADAPPVRSPCGRRSASRCVTPPCTVAVVTVARACRAADGQEEVGAEPRGTLLTPI